MGGEAGIKHGVEFFMALEMARNSERRFRCAPHTEKKRAQSTNQQPGLEHAQHRAAQPAGVADPLPGIVGLGAHQHAGEHIAMAVEIFRRRMKNHIGAEVERTRQHRRGDGRIDCEARTGVMGGAGGGSDVDHIPGWVAR